MFPIWNCQENIELSSFFWKRKKVNILLSNYLFKFITFGFFLVYNSTCEMPSARGPCRASITRFYYNKVTQKCSRFIWGGCEGNGNNFASQLECGITCGKLEEPLEGDDMKNTAGYYSFSTTVPFIHLPGCSVILLHIVHTW